MFALLNPRVWIALALCAVLAFTHFTAYWAGKNTVRAQWNAERIVLQKAAIEAEKAARAREQDLQRKKDEAVNEAANRTQAAQANAAANRALVGSLRDDLAAANRKLSSASVESLRARITALSDVFERCSREYSELAGTAEQISIERETLIKAWPSK